MHLGSAGLDASASVPDNERRPWFTPVHNRPKAGLEVRNLISGTTLQDIYVGLLVSRSQTIADCDDGPAEYIYGIRDDRCD